MKKFFAMLVFFISLLPLHSEILVHDVTFHPDPFYVGDPVEARIELFVDDDFQFVLPEDLPETDFLFIEDVFFETVENHPEQVFLFIRFRSFKVGSSEIPSLAFGDWSMMPISFITNSVVGDRTGELKPAQGQALLPGTRVYIFLMLLILGVLPFGLYILLKYLVQQGRFLFWRFSLGRPIVKVNKLLRKLGHSGNDMDAKSFYMALSEGIKTYLTERFRQDFSSATTRDIAHSPFLNLEPPLKMKLIRLLQKFDLIKFAGEYVSEQERQENLASIKEICSSIEEEAGNDKF